MTPMVSGAPPGIISVEGLRYVYEGADSPALEGIDIEFSRGKSYALLGRNGSGKSTLARCLNGLIVPTAGRVVSCGHDTSRETLSTEAARSVALVFQNPDTQLVGATVEEEVAFGPENLGLPSDRIRARVDEAMERAGVTDLAERQPHRLSQGQKQLVAIAGAIAMEPDFLVSDESTSMLDYSSRQRVLELFEELRSSGMGIIHVTHFLEEAVTADEVVVLESGAVAERGSPSSVLGNPERLRALGLEPLPVSVVTRELERIGHRLPRGVLTAGELVAWLYA